MQSVGLPVSYHKILRSGLVGTFCGIALVTGLSTSSTTKSKSSEHPKNARWSREQQIVSLRMWMDLRASEHVLSLSLFHTLQVSPPSKQSPFVSRQASRCRSSLPLCTPWGLSAHHTEAFAASPLTPCYHIFPRSACCALLTLATPAWTTKDVLLSPPRVLSPPLSGFLLHQRNNNLGEERLIRRVAVMTGGSAWMYIRTMRPFLFQLALKNQSALDVSDTC